MVEGRGILLHLVRAILALIRLAMPLLSWEVVFCLDDGIIALVRVLREMVDGVIRDGH